MKYIYFVRHGESQSNSGVAGIGSDPSLTENGREQAEFIARRCISLPIQSIISSTMNRAHETAEIIGQKLGKPLEMSDLFVERRFPSEYSSVMEKDWPKVRDNINGFFYAPGYHYSDEENFEDIIIRAGEGLEFLSKVKDDHVLVVTHGSFLRDMLALAIFKGDLTVDIRRHLSKGLSTSNTGLTILGFDEKSDQWTIFTWNDYAHLG